MTTCHKNAGRSIFGWTLVLCQFALFILLAWPWVTPVASNVGLLLEVCGVLVGIWTLIHNRIGNFNINPAPKLEGQLVTSGPYRHVRHPMYSAVLLVAAAAIFIYNAEISKIVCWLALLLVLWLKTLLEEQALRHKFPDYSNYAKRAGRFIPRLF
jgi:protein-S-isoprenylcysteine O-methyltransferase Ste14